MSNRRTCRNVARAAAPLVGAGLLALAAGSALAAAPTPISGATPYVDAACDNEALGGTLYRNSEIEPWLGVNPSNPANLIAVWQQDRWSNGGSRGNVSGYSTNRGASWRMVPLPNLTKCTGGPWARATDPWVTFSPNGVAYAMSLVFDNFPPPNRPAGEAPNAMVVQRSTNGGASWSDPVTLIKDTDPRLFSDKNSMTADPNDSNYVYAVWDRLNTPTGALINPENVVGNGYSGPTLFVRTTNGGISWELPRTIYDPGANNQTIGNLIAVLPAAQGGTVLNFFNEILAAKNPAGQGKGTFNLAYVYSPDKGASWLPKGQPRRIQKIDTLAQFRAFGTVLPDDPTIGVRGADILFDVAVDPVNGRLYAVWQDSRFSGGEIDQIAFSQSTDGGATWSAPIKVNQTPTGIPILDQQAFTPSVSVRSNGAVVVTYYDFRADAGNTNPANELADFWAVSCSANCGSAGSWGGELKLTASSFNIVAAPFARGYFLGDYQGLEPVGTDAGAAFAIPQGGDPANIVFQRF